MKKQKDLKTLLLEVDKMFPARNKANLICYNYVLGRFSYGWKLRVIRNWQKWVERKFQTEFGSFKEPEDAVSNFIEYVKFNKINVRKLCRLEK